LEIAPMLKTIRGARFTAVDRVAQIAALQHSNNAWTPHAGSAAFANRTHNISLLQGHTHRRGCKGSILIERILPSYGLRTSSGSLAMFAAIRRA
jgi:hypothetical protein